MSKTFMPLISLFVFISLLSFSKSDEQKLLFPSILTLLNQKLVLVVNNGIHFYNEGLTEEDTSKYIPLTIPSKEDNYKTAMAQFSVEDQGYILILVMNTMYFFEQDGTIITSSDLSSLINGSYYCLTPYKKDGNDLHYIISYIDIESKKLNLHHFVFNIKILINERKNIKNVGIFLRESNESPIDIIGTTCVFLLYPTFNYNVLACMYGVGLPYEIHIRTFDPKNDFNEIGNSNFPYFLDRKSYFDSTPTFISGITLDNIKLFIIFIYNGKLFDMTFDFDNNFSIYNENRYMGLNGIYPLNKIFYFKETHEIVVLADTKNCEVYIFIYNNDLTIKISQLIKQNDCFENYFFTIYFNKENYYIVNDNTAQNKTNLYTTKFNTFRARNLEDGNYSGNIKCRTSTPGSSNYDLCTSCNTDANYYPLRIPKFPDFVECLQTTDAPKNVYLNDTIGEFKLCYETCLTCDGDGDDINNNCLTCDNNHIKKPGFPDTKNCVAKCVYSYYYTPYGYYKCNNNSNCPEEANLYVKDLGKCTDDCKKEENYHYQYNGMCFQNCPGDTNGDNDQKICKERNVESCTKSEQEIDLKEFLTSGGVDLKPKNYAKEFAEYTFKHVSHFYNSQYSILIYQDSNCIEELSIKMPKVDFKGCYIKVQASIKPSTKKIIIELIERLNGQKQSSITYFFYHPETGEKLDANKICADEEIIVQKDVTEQLNNSNVDITSTLFLSDQNINVFDQYSDFYSDICFHYDSPNGKDIPVKERIHIFYPDIALCEPGCSSRGVKEVKGENGTSSIESICECKFNNIFSNDLVEGNALIGSALNSITDIISNSNLDVLKCYKDVFKAEYFTKNIGGFIILFIFVTEIGFSIYLFVNDMSKIIKYLYDLSENFINYMEKKKDPGTRDALSITNKIKIKEPPKKIIKKKRKNTSKPLKSPKMDIIIHDKKKRQTYNSKNFMISNHLKNGLSNSSPYSTIKNTNTNQNLDKNTEKNFEKNRLDTEKESRLIDMEEYLKPDLDDMEYDDAIKLDKRSFCEFFIAKLKTNQIFANTFYYKDNIRPFSIKILILLLDIDLYFTINGLFFSEEYITELYHLEKEDGFFTFIPRSISRFFYTTIASVIIGIILDCIFIEEKKIKRILLREKEDVLQLRYEIALTSKSLHKRYKIFIFICFFIAIISWYYVSCFNNVYKTVKIEWIKSSIVIIIIMQIISLLVSLLESLLREISFQCKSEKIYKFKQILS